MPTILIVDDELACRHPLARLLQLENYTIVQAADGLEALQRLDEQPVDLILLDLLMPKLDGVGFLERMRANPTHAKTAVFLVTAVHDPKMLSRAKDLDIAQYLFKGDVPFTRLLELIKKQLNEPYTPIRRGRRPKNPQAEPPHGHGAKATGGRNNFDRARVTDDESADAEFLRD